MMPHPPRSHPSFSPQPPYFITISRYDYDYVIILRHSRSVYAPDFTIYLIILFFASISPFSFHAIRHYFTPRNALRHYFAAAISPFTAICLIRHFIMPFCRCRALSPPLRHCLRHFAAPIIRYAAMPICRHPAAECHFIDERFSHSARRHC